MHKRMLPLLILCLIPGLFTGCTASSPEDEVYSLLEQFSAMEGYTFSATGEAAYEGAAESNVHLPPLRYVMNGVHVRASERFSAEIRYADAAGEPMYDIMLLQTGGMAYFTFTPFFQYVFTQEYGRGYSMTEAFDGDPFLILPTEDFIEFLPDIPALFRVLDDLDEEELEETLRVDEETGSYALSLAGDQIDQTVLLSLTRPFSLHSTLRPLALEEGAHQEPDIFEPLVSGNMTQYSLDVVFDHDAETGIFTVELTLRAPGLVTIRTEIVYQAAVFPPITSPQNAMEIEEMREILGEYRAAYERARFLEESGLEIIFDLPELHMLDPQLNTDHLELHEIDVNGGTRSVPVLARGHTTEHGGRINSFSWSMVLSYSVIEAFYASETMAMFALQELSVEGFDVEEYQRLPMRVNARDTAAVKALVLYDNHVGPVLVIYVLQTVEDTAQAVFLDIVIMLERINDHDRTVLDRLGFNIGVDLMEYLSKAEAIELGAPEEE